ncbi:unnamed protein product [Oikopleura dioica]|uniref:Uncharacterized protein n=1 Tax=Oikopleura dioica TaxID=34765 RepID=E4X2Q0_OIKDI|nr:unnamed protein product [Oikopleura dioica]
MNLQAENIHSATPNSRSLKPKAGLVKPLQSNNQQVQNTTEMKTQMDTKRKDPDPVERATSAKFLEAEWEQMHADPFINFSDIRHPPAEMCWPLYRVRAKQAFNS